MNGDYPFWNDSESEDSPGLTFLSFTPSYKNLLPDIYRCFLDDYHRVSTFYKKRLPGHAPICNTLQKAVNLRVRYEDFYSTYSLTSAIKQAQEHP